eukprot:6099649-Pleurochrysis_carterae.AAC.2
MKQASGAGRCSDQGLGVEQTEVWLCPGVCEERTKDVVHLRVRHAHPLRYWPPQGLPARRWQQPAVARHAELAIIVVRLRVLTYDLRTLDRASRNPSLPSPAMVRAGAIVPERPSELGYADHRHLVPHTLRLHLGHKRLEALVDLAEAIFKTTLQIVVRVKTAQLDEEGVALRADAVAQFNQLGHLQNVLQA